MAFNPDFGQANEAISRAATAFMQDWVGRRNDKRSMEYLNRSGEMWNEKSEKDAALEVARMIKQNELSEQSRNSEWVNRSPRSPRVALSWLSSRRSS
ncbi:MAG: hypothetical protein MZV70_36190 [Desulfobacterales bacterium]|nr:hypothetical protein [Desulfobacterales bacterium]